MNAARSLSGLGNRSELVGDRVKIFLVLRRIVGLFNEKPGIFWPLSHQRSRLFPNPTDSWSVIINTFFMQTRIVETVHLVVTGQNLPSCGH